jgi:acetylornithine/LysW-gamma-L-lysine aminotransferase
MWNTLTSDEIIAREQQYTSGVYGKRPLAIVRGSGATVWDADGHEYIDCTAGYGVANIGHSRPEIAAVIAAQAQRLITCPEIFHNDLRAQVLERLARLTPEGLDAIFLCNSGTEAIEGAIKFARLATGRSGIVATLRGFHGRTMGALSATWEPHYREPFTPLVPNFTHVRYNDLNAAETAITNETAAFIVEIVQGEGGVHVGTEAYLRGLAQLCHERGALLIIDEVQTGFGRTGRLFACEHYGLQPDILCLAKSIAGGIPMGAVCLGPRVTQSGRIGKGVHGSTFGGNPLACAAALATLDILEQEHLAERAATLGALALQRLRAIQSPLIREVRGLGLLIGIELRQRIQPYLEALAQRGVLALQAGGNVIRLLPPLVISEEQLNRVIDAVEAVLTTPNAHNTRPANVAANATRMEREVALLQQMLTIASYSGQEQTLAYFLVEQARLMGLHAYVDEVGNFVASTHPRERENEREPVVLLGHMDTVHGNIPVRIEDGMLYGRGAVDAKGPLAAFICATARFMHTGQVGRPVVVIGAVEEEAATSRGARAVINRYRPAACIIGEPSSSAAVTIGYKGRLLVECHVTRPMSHSAGSNEHSTEIATAFWERVRQHAEQWNSEHAANSAFNALTPSLRSINSDHADGINEQTHLLIGYRLPPNYDIAALRSLLEAWARESAMSISFSGEEQAFQSTRTTPIARAFIGALRAGGRQATFKYKTGTSDMNVVGPTWGQNIVAYGPGDSRLDHTPDEHIRLDEYAHAIEVLEQVLHTVAGVIDETEHEATGRETTGRETTGREATEREATGHEATGHEATGREATGREATGREATGREATEREATGREATEREATGREATGRDESRPYDEGTRMYNQEQEREGVSA